MKNGYIVGGIAGAIAGIFDGFVSVASYYLGVFIGFYPPLPGTMSITTFLIQLPTTIIWNVFWGIIIAFAFVLVYDSIPGKGAWKGLCFSLIFYLVISNIRAAQITWSLGITEAAIGWIWGGLLPSIVYGLTLGYLYRK